MSRLIQPKAEGEIAFLLKRDLMGPGLTGADILRATEGVLPCMEIVDSRIADWKIGIIDTVADNASCGVFALGGAARDPKKLDLALCGMVFEKNGEVVATGTPEALKTQAARATGTRAAEMSMDDAFVALIEASHSTPAQAA